MSLLGKWIGKAIGLTDGAFWSVYLGGTSRSGRATGPDRSMKISSWWRCVKLYAEVGGIIPMKMYEWLNGDKSDRRQVRDHEVAEIVGLDPNSEQTTAEFWGGQFASLAMFGNAYAEKRYSGKRLVSLEQMPVDTRPFRDQNTGELKYRFLDRGKSETLSADKVLHTRGFGFGGDMGLSPISYARESLAVADAVEEAAQRAFNTGMRATGFFTSGNANVTDTQRKDFYENYVKPVEGAEGEGKQIILPPTFDWKAMNIPAKDMELIMQRRFSVEDICRWMGVPPILAGHSAEGQTMWGSGVENILLAWRVLGLDAQLTFVEKSVNKRCLSAPDRRRFFVEFDRDALLQGDSAARAAFIANQVQFGQMTPNEGRRKQNRPAGEGGDDLLINSTLVPLKLVGLVRAAKVQPAPGEPIPEDPE
jgi:HK97 family phage portal protein